MYVLLRLMKTAFQAWRRDENLGVSDVSRVTLRVWPNDLDTNWHLNNGRYLTLMDIGRFDFIIRAGMLPVLIKNRWGPVLGAATIRFRKPLNPFARFVLETRIIHWDEKWIYMDQRLVNAEGRIAAHALLKSAFFGKGQLVTPEQLLAAMGQDMAPPPPPEHLTAWLAAEAALAEVSRAVDQAAMSPQDT